MEKMNSAWWRHHNVIKKNYTFVKFGFIDIIIIIIIVLYDIIFLSYTNNVILGHFC